MTLPFLPCTPTCYPDQPQAIAKSPRGPRRLSPNGLTLPSLLPPCVTHPFSMTSVLQVPKILLGRLACQIEALHPTYGRRCPVSYAQSQGRCIWHFPGAGRGIATHRSHSSSSLCLCSWTARQWGAAQGAPNHYSPSSAQGYGFR